MRLGRAGTVIREALGGAPVDLTDLVPRPPALRKVHEPERAVGPKRVEEEGRRIRCADLLPKVIVKATLDEGAAPTFLVSEQWLDQARVEPYANPAAELPVSSLR